MEILKYETVKESKSRSRTKNGYIYENILHIDISEEVVVDTSYMINLIRRYSMQMKEGKFILVCWLENHREWRFWVEWNTDLSGTKVINVKPEGVIGITYKQGTNYEDIINEEKLISHILKCSANAHY